MIFGGVLVGAGIIAGLVLAFDVEPNACDETFQSCSHPHLAFGVTLIGASMFAAVLLALVGIVARRVLESLPRRRE